MISLVFIFITEKMYPSQLGLSSNEYKYEWLREMFTDEDGNISIIYLSLSLTDLPCSIILQSSIDSNPLMSFSQAEASARRRPCPIFPIRLL
jgi:hypothetical protein